MAAAAALPHLRRTRQLWIERLTGAGFAVPAFILLLLVNLLPLIAVLYLSLTDYEFGALDARFVGLANLKKALADAQAKLDAIANIEGSSNNRRPTTPEGRKP